DALAHLDKPDLPRSVDLLRWAWANAGQIENHEFIRKYISTSEVTVNVAEGVAATLPISRDAIGLTLAEVEQTLGNIDAAITVAEHLAPSHIAAVSLCELYHRAGRYDGIIEVTNEITNQDDPTALLLTYRGIALRQQGHDTASLGAFKQALKSSKREAA